MKMKFIIFTLFLLIFSLDLYGQDNIYKSEEKFIEKEFVFDKFFIIHSTGEPPTIKTLYKSTKGGMIEVYMAVWDKAENALKKYNASKKNYLSCENDDDVTNHEDKIVGKRTLCKDAKDFSIIIFSYDDQFIMFKGENSSSVLAYEKQSCLRSKKIKGVSCKY
jgi:hypothetical protein